VTLAFGRALSSLTIPNYRRYFAGQIVSLSGNWMQTVAEMWLVVQLTGSGVSVGLTAALQFLPMLLLGAYGGVVADRIDKRRLLTITQPLAALPPLTLFVLVQTGGAQVGVVYALVFLRGLVNAFDNPARQAFVSELVGPERVVNAVSLNSVLLHCARIVGPALAGIVIAVAGVGPCFALNALSFGAMFIALRAMDPAALDRRPPALRARGQIREAAREAWRRPALRVPLAMMVLVGTLSFNFQVLLPLFADFTWHGTAAAYALLTSAMAVGSVGGALAAGARGRVSPSLLVVAAALFGIGQLAAAAAPSLGVQALTLVPVGAASVTFAAGVNSSLQLAAPPHLRGRIMALYSVVFIGSTPIGAPLVGWLAEAAGPRAGLVLGGIAALTAAGCAQVFLRRALVDTKGTPRTFRSRWASGRIKSSATVPPTSGSTRPHDPPRARPSRLRPRPRRAGAAASSPPSSPRSSSSRR
jgi:MFS family permease